MSKRYVVYLVHADQGKSARVLRARVRSALKLLDIPGDLLSIRSSLPPVDDAQTVRVCIYLGSKRGKGNASCHAAIQTALERGIATFPVVPQGALFTEVTPEILNEFNAFQCDGRDPFRRLSQVILRTLHLTDIQRRVFISYARKDATAMAEQLWEALSARGFEVFLDRVSLDTGANWRERLFEALERKSFVLMIESPEAVTAKGVEMEFNYARERDMGLLTLTWHQTVDRGLTLPGIYEKYRTHLPKSALRSDRVGNVRLKSHVVQKVLDEIESRHAEALLRRRRAVLGSLMRALEWQGISFKGISQWSLVADMVARGWKYDLVFSVTPRAPEVPDLYVLDSARQYDKGREADGILVHTMRAVPSQTAGLLDWVIAGRRIKSIADDEIVRFVSGL